MQEICICPDCGAKLSATLECTGCKKRFEYWINRMRAMGEKIK